MTEFATDNALLRSLSTADLETLRPHLHRFELKTGASLYEMEDLAEWVICPKSACCR